MTFLIPQLGAGRVTLNYVGGNNAGGFTTTANVDLGTQASDRRVVILATQRLSLAAPTFSNFSMTGSPTIDTLATASFVDAFSLGQTLAMGVAHVPTGTTVSVTAQFGGPANPGPNCSIMVYSVYGLSSNTPYANAVFGSFNFPPGSAAIAMGFSQASTPTWTGATQDAYEGQCSGASYTTELEELGRSISAVSAGGVNIGRVTVWAPG